MNKALFLDRDGVININIPHTYEIDQFHFIPGIFDFCKKFQDKGYLLFVITNQSGIARGLYTREDFNKLTQWMTQVFRSNGVIITKVYFCPHHPDFTGPCECRKPRPGMILKAKKEFNLDLSLSVLVGDKISDIKAGENAGIENNLLFDGDFNDLLPKINTL